MLAREVAHRVADDRRERQPIAELLQHRRARRILDERVVEHALEHLALGVDVGDALHLVGDRGEVLALDAELVERLRVAGGDGLEAHAAPPVEALSEEPRPFRYSSASRS